VIPPDRAACDCTAAQRRDWLHAPETILLVTLAVLAGAFATTALAARVYHNRRRVLAESWLRQGSADLRDGHSASALSDLQTALIYARQDVPEEQQQAYSLDLAQALVANHRLDEARAYLIDLWERAPDSAKLNLELARLAVETGDDSGAKRYYANAIYGIWDGNPQQIQQNQRDTQLEFCRYLIGRGERTAAYSVLVAVTASLPPDPALHTQVGGMLIEVGANAQALAQFQEALELDRRNHAALVSAGLASFALGDDRAAVRYLGQASREKPQPGQAEALDPAVARDLAVATAVVALDTSQPGLTIPERAERSARSYQLAKARLEGCANKLGVSLPKPVAATAGSAGAPATNANPAPDDVPAVYAQALKMQGSSREAELTRDPRLIDSLVKVVGQMEFAASANCGPAVEVEDEALVRIAQRAAAAQP